MTAALARPEARTPKALRHPGDESAGDEQRPALDVDGADERREQRRREHEPRRRFSQRGAGDTGNEESADAELSDRQRGGLAHRQERQQRR